MKVKVTLQVAVELTVEAETFEQAVTAAGAVERADLDYLVHAADSVSTCARVYDLPNETPAKLRAEYVDGVWVLI